MTDPDAPTTPEVLGRPLTADAVERLHESGLLSAEARDAALDRIQSPADWPSWLRLRLLFLGTALLLAGIVFFFAYNWASLGRFAKLGIVQAGLVAAVAAACAVGPDRLTGRVLLLAANMMVGVVLAVIGQVYQTGADAWELFAAWSLLTAVWALISNFAAHWILWMAVTHAAAILFWKQTVDAPASGLCILLAAFDGLAFMSREVAVRRGMTWASGTWVRDLLWLAVVGCLTVPPCVAIVVDADSSRIGPFALPGVGAWALALPAGWWWFRCRARDLGGLIFVAMSFCTVALALAGRLLFDQAPDAGAFLAFGVATLVVVGGSAAVLWKAHLAMRRDSRG